MIFTGANVHLRSGTGLTDDAGTPTGRGNLVLGYNELPITPPPLAAGERGGSHNLVVGPGHRYSSTGGLVAGFENRIAGPSVSVSGGQLNTAMGFFSSVSGGFMHFAPGDFDWKAGSLFEEF